MNWLLWRQHRSQGLLIALVLAGFGVAVLLTGVHMANIYRDALRNCSGNGSCDFAGDLFNGYGAIVDVVHLSIALPVLLGVFLGATLVARETEHATNGLVWTQTVTRRTWLLAKIATVVVITLVTSAAVSALVTWWSGTPNALNGNRFEGAEFDTQNIAPIAFALFAVGLGIAAGAVFRRILPALAATVGIYVAVRLIVGVYLRRHYMAPLAKSFPVGADRTPLPSGSWTMSRYIVDPSGHSIGGGRFPIPDACSSFANGKGGALNCLSRLGFHEVVKYQPASHYWQFQWIEAGIFVVLAAAAIGFAIVYTLHHDA
jgi:hypothetical protein